MNEFFKEFWKMIHGWDGEGQFLFFVFVILVIVGMIEGSAFLATVWRVGYWPQ